MYQKNLLKNDSENLNKISCPICFSKLLFKSLNKENQLLACSNDFCLFPLNSQNMENFILNINKDTLNNFFENLKKFVIEQSSKSETNNEEKIKKENNEDIEFTNKEISELSYDGRSSLIFSPGTFSNF